MARSFSGIIGLVTGLILTFGIGDAFATSHTGEPSSPATATFKSRCEDVPDGYPPCANAPSECGSDPATGNTPFNCVFLQEAIGGRPGFDLYKVSCHENAGAVAPAEEGGENTAASEICEYTLWYGEAIVGRDSGPFQALLAYEPGNETQGPFGLLYSYLGLVYNFMSGIIIGVVVLISIAGGIRISTAGGDQQGYEAGRSMIIKALIGMVLWFTASVILYTINPTFFAF